MTSLKKKLSPSIFITLFLSLLMPFLFFIAPSHASEKQLPINSNQINLHAKSAIAVDADSGQIIYAKNENKKMPTASISKLVTIYILLNQIKNHNVAWNNRVKISPAIAKLSNNKDYTNVPLKAGKSYTVKQLYEASLISSANGAAMALGDYLNNNNADNFGIVMNQTVASSGIKNYHFYNACGLNNEALGNLKNPKVNNKAENEMSAKGLARLSQRIIQVYPEILQTTSKPTLEWNGKKYFNTNMLLRAAGPFKFDGLKTGTSPTAGENFVGTATKGKSRIITVIMGAPKDKKFVETKLLLASIQENLKTTRITNKVLPDNSKQQNKIGLKYQGSYWLPKKQIVSDKFIPNHNYRVLQAINIPIASNEKVGNVAVKTNANNFHFLPAHSRNIPVVLTNKNEVTLMKIVISLVELLLFLLIFAIIKMK